MRSAKTFICAVEAYVGAKIHQGRGALPGSGTLAWLMQRGQAGESRGLTGTREINLERCCCKCRKERQKYWYSHHESRFGACWKMRKREENASSDLVHETTFMSALIHLPAARSSLAQLHLHSDSCNACQAIRHPLDLAPAGP
jgi:hypothetical protein